MPVRVRAALGYVALYAAIGAQAPYLVLYYQSLGFDVAAIGRIVGAAALIGLAAAPLWGSVSDRLRGAPRVLAAATLVAACGALGLSMSREPAAVVLSAATLATGLAGIAPILDARALEVAGPDRTGYGAMRAWGSVSYVVSVFVTGLAIDRWGLGAAFAVLVPALLLTGVAGSTLPGAGARVDARPLRSAGRLFGPRGLGVFLMGAFVTWTALGVVMGFYALRLRELGAGASVVGLAGALGAAVEVPIMLRFAGLARRFGAERLLVLGSAIFVARAVVAGIADQPALLVLASGVSGVGFACFLVGGITYVARHAPPELAATAQGIFQGVTVSLAQVSAAAVGGAVGAVTGLARLYLLAAVVGAVGVAIVVLAVGPGSATRGRPGSAGTRAGTAAGP